MANLKEIRVRLDSVKSTKQITSAMKMVSAAKLRKAQDAILQMRPFSKKLDQIFNTAISTFDEPAENEFFQANTSDRVLMIAISSNRGLCGAFNSSIIKKTLSLATENFEAALRENKLELFCIGKKAYDGLKLKLKANIEFNHSIFDKLTFENSCIISDKLITGYLTNKYRTILLIYNQFRNAAIQDVVVEQFLPVVIDRSSQQHIEDPLNYIYEPSVLSLLQNLIPLSLRIHFFKVLLDSWASEHGARMTAMHKATDNATDFIRDLELTYNKARQASITKELSEIVSGANALKG